MGDSNMAPQVPVRILVTFGAAVLGVVALFAFMANQDENATSSVTSLFAGETELAVTLPKATAADCANVKDWNFMNVDENGDPVRVTQNNLGGQGPDTDGNEEIRYSNVADQIDLILEIESGSYTTNPTRKDEAKNKCIKGKDAGCPAAGMTCGNDANGLNGRFGQVNVKGGTTANLKFTLVDAGTNNPVDIAPDQKAFFSVFDLDNGIQAKQQTREVLTLNTRPESFSLSTGTPATQVKAWNWKKGQFPIKFQSSVKGSDEDNPTDPLAMTDVQKQRAVWVTYKGTSTWSMTFGEIGNKSGKAGRNLLFAGRAEGACPPGPVAPPPGACKVGIEGMIKAAAGCAVPKNATDPVVLTGSSTRTHPTIAAVLPATRARTEQ